MYGDRDAARQRALADALNQASLSLGARVLTTEQLNAGDVPLQSLQIRPTQRVARYSILREWEDQGIYHVAVSAEGERDESATKNLAGIRALKKKIVFTQFDVANTIQVDDIRNIYDGLPIEISKRLEAGGGFLVNYVSRYVPSHADALQREAIMRIANEVGAQFVVSGLVLDAEIKQTFARANKRHFKIEFVIHDALTGVRLLSHHLEDDAQGDVIIGNDKPFGSSGFFETDSGHVLDGLIGSVVKNISAALACLPFSASVVRVEGKNVYLDAGAASMLKVGDKLVLYTSDFLTPIVSTGGLSLGVPERPVTTLTLTKIQPLFSIGDLAENVTNHGVKIGSIARFEFLDKERGSFECLQ